MMMGALILSVMLAVVPDYPSAVLQVSALAGGTVGLAGTTAMAFSPRLRESEPYNTTLKANAVLTVGALLASQAVRSGVADDWLHGTASANLTVLGYGAGRALRLNHWQAMAAGAAVSLAAGAGKEALDSRSGSGWSWREIGCDLLGITVGVGALLAGGARVE